MSESTWRETSDGPYDGETRKLSLPPEGGKACRGIHFPWQVLWLIWPLMFFLKGGAFITAPIVALIAHCAICSATIPPLLLIGAGLAIILIGNARRRGR